MTKRTWTWGAVAAAATLLVAVGAFLARGPVGIGTGPLDIAFVASTGTVPQARPAVILIPIGTASSTPAVIDQVGIAGGGGYPAPRLLSVVGDQDQACTGIWWPVNGAGSFRQRCATGGTVPLVGRVVPERHPALTSADAARPAARTIDVGIEVGSPGPAGCWDVTRVTVHYHVGSRHYTAVGAESLSGCTPSAGLGPNGQPRTARPGTAAASPVAASPAAAS